MQVTERTEGRYDAREVEFGTIYRWRPECVVVECDCGERSILTASTTTCGECGVDHGNAIRKEPAVRQLRDEIAHPWRYAGDREDVGIPC